MVVGEAITAGCLALTGLTVMVPAVAVEFMVYSTGVYFARTPTGKLNKALAPNGNSFRTPLSLIAPFSMIILVMPKEPAVVEEGPNVNL